MPALLVVKSPGAIVRFFAIHYIPSLRVRMGWTNMNTTIMSSPHRKRRWPPRSSARRLVAQLRARAIGAVVARFLHTEEVTGSNPVSPTTSGSYGTNNARICGPATMTTATAARIQPTIRHFVTSGDFSSDIAFASRRSYLQATCCPAGQPALHTSLLLRQRL